MKRLEGKAGTITELRTWHAAQCPFPRGQGECLCRHEETEIEIEIEVVDVQELPGQDSNLEKQDQNLL